MESLQAIGPEELARRWARAERRIRENGITYNVYGDPLGASRAWQIDIVPLLIQADEWRLIEAGVIQRAVFSICFSRIFMGSKIWCAGPLSGGAALCQPGRFFVRWSACLFPRTAICTCLPLILPVLRMAVVVLADRTQAPSAAAMHWRIAPSSPMFLPDLFRTSNVLRLAPFFRANAMCSPTYAAQQSANRFADSRALTRLILNTPTLRAILGSPSSRSRPNRSQPSCLSQNRRRPRKSRCNLRRVDDSFCDPLELRGDSLLGVPWVSDAIVAGNVKVANALGSGLIETARSCLSSGLCSHLLGEKLRLPSVATWWCGQNYALDWVLDHLDP